MPSTQQLHKLINSMDKEEKKFFRAYHKLLSNRKHQTNLLQLYDSLEAMKTYSDHAFEKKAAGKAYAKSLSVNKVKLEESLGKALTIYNLDKNAENRLAAEMVYATALTEKGLFDLAKRQLDKSRKTAVEYELFDQHITLNLIAERIPMQGYPANIQILNETENLLKKINNRNNYVIRKKESRHKVYTIGLSNIDKMKAEAQRLLASEEYLNLDKGLSFKAKAHILNIRKHLLFVEQKFDEVYHNLLEEIDLWKQYPKQIELNPRAVFILMRDAIASNVSTAYNLPANGRITLANEAAAMLTGMREAEKKHALTIRSKLFARGVILECEIYYEQYYNSIENFIARYQKNLPELEKLKTQKALAFPALLSLIKLEITSFLFTNDQKALAEKIVDEMLNQNRQAVSIDTYAYFCFYSILLRYEKSEFSLMASRLGTFERHIKANNLSDTGEKAVIAVLKELLRKQKVDVKHYINQVLQMPLEQYKFQTQLLKISNFSDWLEKVKHL